MEEKRPWLERELRLAKLAEEDYPLQEAVPEVN